MSDSPRGDNSRKKAARANAKRMLPDTLQPLFVDFRYRTRMPSLAGRILRIPRLGEFEIHGRPTLREAWKSHPQGFLPMLAVTGYVTGPIVAGISAGELHPGLLAIPALLVIVTVACFYRTQRLLILKRHPEQCISCGYPRAGDMDTRCPECGVVPPQAAFKRPTMFALTPLGCTAIRWFSVAIALFGFSVGAVALIRAISR